MKEIILLGSTGSIGESALDVVRASSGALRVAVLCAGSNASRLAEQAREFRPDLAVVADEKEEESLRDALAGLGVETASGEGGLKRAATHPSPKLVLSAIVGAAGIQPAYWALEAGKDLALANKETLVAAGAIVVEEARRKGGAILPVDSEHSALFQILEGKENRGVERLYLTASGGSFWSDPGLDLWEVTPEDALRHPRWSMGAKVTIDSATMMNKGLEVIEAHWLFGFPLDRIEVLVHPQSIVHAVVEYVDGSMMAHLSKPDMRLPIAAALYYPEKVAQPWPRLDLAESRLLEFYPPDHERFPAIRLARRAQEAGGGAPAALNAANEVAVEAFLKGFIRFPEIVGISEKILEDLPAMPQSPSVEDVLRYDALSRNNAMEIVRELSSSGRT